VIQLETELKNAKNDEDIQRQENESEIEKANLNLEFSKLEIERYVEGDHPQKKRDLELRIEAAESRLSQAEDKWKQMPRLLEAGFVTPVEAEEKELAFKEAKNELDSAKLALKLYLEYTHPMELRQKQADVTEAERELSRVKVRSEGRLDSKIAIVRQKQRQYDAAVQKLAEAKEEFQNLTIRAPQPGRVIYSERRDRRGEVEETVKVGGTAYPGRTLIELPDLTRMDVEIQVHQADIGKVRKGQSVWVEIPGRKGGPLKGTVAEIGAVAQSRSWRDPVKRFDVVVQIDGEVEGLKAGITAEVEVNVAELKNVLYVPLQSVGSSAGTYFVYVREGDETIKRPVDLGGSNDQYVEVRSGLKEGARVLLVNPDVVTEDETEGAGESGNGRPGGMPGNRGRSGGGRSGTR
jgi:RND family efflux transporter MFP subunit